MVDEVPHVDGVLAVALPREQDMSYDTAPTDPHHGGKITFADYKLMLIEEYMRQRGDTREEATMYVHEVGDQTWRESYDDGLSADDVVHEDCSDAMMGE